MRGMSVVLVLYRRDNLPCFASIQNESYGYVIPVAFRSPIQFAFPEQNSPLIGLHCALSVLSAASWMYSTWSYLRPEVSRLLPMYVASDSMPQCFCPLSVRTGMVRFRNTHSTPPLCTAHLVYGHKAQEVSHYGQYLETPASVHEA